MHTSIHPRRPRGGQLGREKRRRKFSRTVERAPGMLLLTSHIHDSLECFSLIIFCAQSEASILIALLLDLIVWRSLPANENVWVMQGNFLREQFSVKMGLTKPKKSLNNFSPALKPEFFWVLFQLLRLFIQSRRSCRLSSRAVIKSHNSCFHAKQNKTKNAPTKEIWTDRR